ncbi:hypothetical protein SAMN05216567_105433 [Variovorax sp. OK605]|jgi:mannose-6-phosphate isomerase-like protein (cupin superfamily)|uniref:cupin domain-containing protein n=1 Tax=Variovorax sp. OK605 TaxID=1855317 RepID=UPI0008E6F604|nr:cupin domain-containing protein [Variovorax sp. OK605]SFP33965.1 hypothetical protein SAMN05216567_105433 [Variovorax sp. OK605]
MRPFLVGFLLACLQCLSPTAATAQTPLAINTLVEKKVAELPPGPLFWRIASFATREQAERAEQAQGAASKWALVAESAGKVWLFTLGPAGGVSADGRTVAEVGPIARVDAPQYLLRINEASGPPGSTTPVHMHPGSEAFFVLSGEQSIRSAHGTMRVGPGQPEAGHGAGMAMQVSSSGTMDLRALVMFVVDATQPFSSPASIP